MNADAREGRWFGLKKTECGLNTDLVSQANRCCERIELQNCPYLRRLKYPSWILFIGLLISCWNNRSAPGTVAGRLWNGGDIHYCSHHFL
jgi:hypothetical protein